MTFNGIYSLSDSFINDNVEFESNDSEFYNKKRQRRKNIHLKNTKSKGGCTKKYNNAKNNYLIDVYNNTVEFFETSNIHPKEPSILYDINNIDIECVSNHVESPNETPSNETLSNENVSDCECSVLNIDTLDCALSLCSEGLRPLVLNMASDYKPGGGVKSGKTAQEECIFRRTDAYRTHYESFYQLSIEHVIYSPSVTIIKDSQYNMLDEDKICNVGIIAVPAIRKPKLIDGMYHEDDRELMTLKIESIFKIAKKHNYDSLVLGALGCGVFKNPPNEVASIFKCMLTTYKKYFKKIVFAVLSVDNNDENYNTFSHLFRKTL